MIDVPVIDGCIIGIHPSHERLAFSRCGRIWTYRDHRGKYKISPRWSEIRGCVNGDGHLVVSTKGHKQIRVHVAILETFISPKPEGKWGLHKDDDKSNNSVENLYWGTVIDNTADRIRNGQQIHGDSCHTCKLTTEKVAEIRRRWQLGNVAQQSLADEFGVNQTAISAIVRRETWKHVYP